MSELPLTDDELLSSFLDGEVTAEQRAQIDSRLAVEPELRGRLDSLRGAAALLATDVVPLGPDDREQLLGAALAAGTTAPNITDLASARARTDSWRTKFVGVAAAVIALAIAVPALRALDTSDADTEATATAPSDEAAPLVDSDAAPDEMATPDDVQDTGESGDSATAGRDATSSTAPAQLDNFFALAGPTIGFDPLPDDLGEFDDLTSVRAAARSAWTDAARNGSSEFDEVPATSMDPAIPTMNEEASNAFLNSYGGCGEAIGSVANYSFAAPLGAVDYAEARVGDDVFTVGLFELSDGSGVVLVLETNRCTITEDEALPAP